MRPSNHLFGSPGAALAPSSRARSSNGGYSSSDSGSSEIGSTSFSSCHHVFDWMALSPAGQTGAVASTACCGTDRGRGCGAAACFSFIHLGFAPRPRPRPAIAAGLFPASTTPPLTPRCTVCPDRCGLQASTGHHREMRHRGQPVRSSRSVSQHAAASAESHYCT